MKPSTILKKARGYIEKGWCVRSLAKNANGIGVSPQAKSAVRWCALGAVMKAQEEHSWYTPSMDFLRRVLPSGIAEFNNAQRNKRPVVAAFNRAIRLAEGEGQ